MVPRHGGDGWELVEYDRETGRYVYEHPRHGRCVLSTGRGFWPGLRELMRDVPS